MTEADRGDPGLEMEVFWAVLLELARWEPYAFGRSLDFYDKRVKEPESLRRIINDHVPDYRH